MYWLNLKPKPYIGGKDSAHNTEVSIETGENGIEIFAGSQGYNESENFRGTIDGNFLLCELADDLPITPDNLRAAGYYEEDGESWRSHEHHTPRTACLYIAFLPDSHYADNPLVVAVLDNGDTFTEDTIPLPHINTMHKLNLAVYAITGKLMG